MRKNFNKQSKFEKKDILKVKINTKSRDDIPKILLAVQHTYKNEEIRDQIFEILNRLGSQPVNQKKCGPTMGLWEIFVLVLLQIGLKCDHDHLMELANNHSTVREVLGHGFFDKTRYETMIIQNDLSLFDSDMLSEIKDIISKSGCRFPGMRQKKVYEKSQEITS